MASPALSLYITRTMNDPTGSQAPLRWRSTACTDVGAVRKINEDSMLVRPDRGLWAVADGMGGHSAGDKASQLVVERLDKVSLGDDLAECINTIDDVLVESNTELRELAKSESKRTIGCTAAAIVARGNHVACLWAGDSRVYRVRPGDGFSQLTQDHAMVEALVTQGILSREEAENHPQANLITRAVGASDVLLVDVELFEVRPGDVLMLCSDGLYKEVNNAEIAEIMADRSTEDRARALVELALSRRARDNTTVIVVEFEGGAGE
jgi:serine/threonine protein phosphatase PrpC